MEYILKYSKRRTIGISINNKGVVTVTSPRNAPRHLIDEVVKEKESWILKKIKSINNSLIRHKEDKYIEGEEHLYLGKYHKLKLINSKFDQVYINGASIIIESRDPSNELKTKHLLNSWYLNTSQNYLNERANTLFVEFSNKYNLKRPTIHVEKMRGKWGSCHSKGLVKLNKDLIKTPIVCIDYVIMHEFCHLLEQNHGASFYRYLKQFIPNWKALRSMLKQYSSVSY